MGGLGRNKPPPSCLAGLPPAEDSLGPGEDSTTWARGTFSRVRELLSDLRWLLLKVQGAWESWSHHGTHSGFHSHGWKWLCGQRHPGLSACMVPAPHCAGESTAVSSPQDFCPLNTIAVPQNSPNILPSIPGDCKSQQLGKRNQSQSCHVNPVSTCWLFFFYIYIKIYLFLALLGLLCCARAFSSCGERGLLFIAVHGLLIAVASLAAEHGL